MRAPITDKHLLEMMWERFPEIMQRGAEQPAQRTWVGLTDEELRQVWYDDAPVQGGTYIDKLRQVETKLKEKNT